MHLFSDVYLTGREREGIGGGCPGCRNPSSPDDTDALPTLCGAG